MNPIDFRNENFAAIRGRLTAKREAVWLDWQAYEIEQQAAGGAVGATTRQVCQRFGRDILQFRPRCTELYQMGALAMVDHDVTTPARASSPGGEDTGEGGPRTPSRREGSYRLRSLTEWEQWHAQQIAHAVSAQQQLI